MPAASPPPPPPPGSLPLRAFVGRALVVIGLVALALFLWWARSALLLGFAGLLLAVFLHGLARLLSRRLPLPYTWALALTVAAIVAVLAAFGWLAGPRVAAEMEQLVNDLPGSYEAAIQELESRGWGARLAALLPDEPVGAAFLDVPRMVGWASAALNGLLSGVLITFVGLFIAARPGLYRRGALHLVPPAYRARAGAVLDQTGRALWHWLLGQGVAMLIVFVLVYAGLRLIGVPLALALATIAALFDFVPLVGPTVAAVPAILLALTVSPADALYTTLLYLAVQQVEGNVITPLVQQRMTSLPPALLILALAAFGALFGLMGVLLAAPLLVVAMVFVGTLYVEGTLGDDVQNLPGETPEEDEAERAEGG